jgi:hypothetical protein
MLFHDYTYSPTPALPDVRLSCEITKHNNEDEQDEIIVAQYQIHPQHRNRTPDKSQWSISYEDEISLFADTLCKGVIFKEQYMWTLYIPQNLPEVLGVTARGEDSKIAIFDNGLHNGFWHGYPADYIKNSQDIPPAYFLQSWYQAGIISAATMRRIKGGQPCNL